MFLDRIRTLIFRYVIQLVITVGKYALSCLLTSFFNK